MGVGEFCQKWCSVRGRKGQDDTEREREAIGRPRKFPRGRGLRKGETVGVWGGD